jgi:small nuclear ribonucleoprotein (snRNP)-like protein
MCLRKLQSGVQLQPLLRHRAACAFVLTRVQFMNVTLDQAQEVDTRTKEVPPPPHPYVPRPLSLTRAQVKALGRILLRGDNIALIQTTAATVGY